MEKLVHSGTLTPISSGCDEALLSMDAAYPIKKTDIVRDAIRTEDWKKALRIAKDFRINITRAQREDMSRAYECMVHPEFYRQIGIDTHRAIARGKEVLSGLYGA